MLAVAYFLGSGMETISITSYVHIDERGSTQMNKALLTLNKGATGKVKMIEAGRCATRRLYEMGFNIELARKGNQKRCRPGYCFPHWKQGCIRTWAGKKNTVRNIKYNE
ncbi:MAG: hypothetical protein RQM92_00400 [Candidatus Syntrophopropionicum ammoniitolerans]